MPLYLEMNPISEPDQAVGVWKGSGSIIFEYKQYPKRGQIDLQNCFKLSNQMFVTLLPGFVINMIKPVFLMGRDTVAKLARGEDV